MGRLKDIRLKRKKSQKDVAKYLGISQQGYALYEKWDSDSSKGREPKMDTWKKIADYFDVSVSYLIGLTDIEDVFTTDWDRNILNKSSRDSFDNFNFVEDEMLENRMKELYNLTFGEDKESRKESLKDMDLVEIGKITDNIFVSLLSSGSAMNDPENEYKEEDKYIYNLIKKFSELLKYATLIDLDVTYDTNKMKVLENKIIEKAQKIKANGKNNEQA